MTKPTKQAVAEILGRLAEIKPRGRDEEAIYGLLVGALYGLRRAFDLGYVDRAGDGLPSDYYKELVRVACNLATTGDVAESAWLAGYYFNSSLHRFAPVGERLGKYAGDRQDLVPRVRKEMNRIKHDVDGLLGGPEVSAG